MTRPIGTIKKEIRTLGLDICNPRLTIGAIVRGGTYLDGVVSFPSSRNNASRTLAKRIIESEYFPELRAIMQYDPDDQLDSTVVERIPNCQRSSFLTTNLMMAEDTNASKAI